MRIGFIGAGKMGFTLGKYLIEKKHSLTFRTVDYDVVGFFSRNVNSAKAAAAFTNTEYYEKIDELVDASDVIFVTVPDSQIAIIVETLDRLGDKIAGKIICHTSGALSSQAFSGMNNQVYGYSVHPIYAVSSKTESYKKFNECFITIEGNADKIETVNKLFEQFGNKVAIIDCDNKVKYHSAAVFASNLVIGLFSMAKDLLQQCGFSSENASTALKPLFINNANSIFQSDNLRKVLTGPVDRADLETINKHMSVLEGDKLEVYKLLSNELVKLVEQENFDKYTEIKTILNKDNT